jgi:hypothetical protein
MPKKSKRSKAKFKYTASAPATDVGKSPGTLSSVRVASHIQTATLATLQEQYKYIRSELVRICIIAGVFFIILIVLSFFI